MAAVLNNPPGSKRWTFADLAQFDESERYEIYDGKLIPTAPAPDLYHQRLVLRLCRLLDGFVQSHDLGEVIVSPADVVLSEDNTTQPDLLFIAKENANIATNWVAGAPDLVVEIFPRPAFGAIATKNESNTPALESKNTGSSIPRADPLKS